MIVVFHALSEEHFAANRGHPARAAAKRLEERHITLKVTLAAKEHLVRIGSIRRYAAAKRVIQKEIETALGKAILKGEVQDARRCSSITIRTPRADFPARDRSGEKEVAATRSSRS